MSTAPPSADYTSDEVLTVACMCGAQAEGTYAMLRTAKWYWSVAWRGWCCPRCRPKAPSPPHERS